VLKQNNLVPRHDSTNLGLHNYHDDGYQSWAPRRVVSGTSQIKCYKFHSVIIDGLVEIFCSGGKTELFACPACFCVPVGNNHSWTRSSTRSAFPCKMLLLTRRFLMCWEDHEGVKTWLGKEGGGSFRTIKTIMEEFLQRADNFTELAPRLEGVEKETLLNAPVHAVEDQQ